MTNYRKAFFFALMGNLALASILIGLGGRGESLRRGRTV